ncbi:MULTISPECIES: ATP-binding protein [Ruegeria]|uniref:ATP-binding protein n=1 Tax=Ruegeria TaxID=97050 RepID=UPI00147C330D|nr:MULTISPECIES: ATP-binding protein [Ruegeria]
MSAEPLKIDDDRFLINRLIEQAPTHTLVREFFMNAQENAALAPEGQRTVRIYPTKIDGVRKLTFWNTGPGMSEKDLRVATNLSSSINKQLALDENFGIGAKVSGLTINPEGIRYRSCRDGIIHEVTIGYDEELQTYVRFPFQFDDGSEDTVFDVTWLATSEGMPKNTDWTEVVLLGEDHDHDTVERPIGKKVSVDRSYIATQIFQRFAEFRPGVEVFVNTAMTKGGGKFEEDRFRSLKPLSFIVPELPNAEKVTCPETGVTVHYIHDPKHDRYSHTLSSLKNPATQSTTFCALVHKAERYDIKNKKKWSTVAPNFGIPFGSTVLTIEIVLPDEMALPNQYRDGLTLPSDRSALTAEHFATLVRELMPQWVKDVIKDAHPPSDDNLDDLQKDLQKVLDEFKVPTVAFSPSKSLPDKVDLFDQGTDETEPSNSEGFSEDEEGLVRRIDAQSKRASATRVRRAPEGAKLSKETKALERVPEIEILVKPEDIEAKGIKGRAGKYYKDAQTLFVNGKYSAVDRMAQELELHFAGQVEAEELRKLVLRAAQRFTAFRVGKATCYAISKRLSEDWSVDDLDRATSPESLSLAADDYRQSINVARKWIRTELKAEALEIEDAAMD